AGQCRLAGFGAVRAHPPNGRSRARGAAHPPTAPRRHDGRSGRPITRALRSEDHRDMSSVTIPHRRGSRMVAILLAAALLGGIAGATIGVLLAGDGSGATEVQVASSPTQTTSRSSPGASLS